MHPAISTALLEHSDVFENPLWRLIRSAGPILGVIYDENWDAVATARAIRARHAVVRGRDELGWRYHALDPEVFYWAHATFFEGQIATQELFGTPLDDGEKERLYAESITWYSRYGMTMRPVPADYGAFERYWERMHDDVLAATPVAMAAIAPGFDLGSPHPRIDGPAWRAAKAPLSWVASSLLRSTLPPRAREVLGISDRAADRLTLSGVQTLTRTTWPVVPASLKRFPRASTGNERTR